MSDNPVCARLDLRLDSALPEIERLAEAVEAFCTDQGLSPHTAFQFNLCFDELLTNTILHGLNGASGHRIDVHLSLSQGWLEGGIVDEAPPYDPWDRPPADTDAPIEDRDIGGLGVHIVRTIMEAVHYARVEGQNRITFGKPLDAPDHQQGNAQ
jgi:anti-sigma regulatory factor (Ser/Thr protein kinase)